MLGQFPIRRIGAYLIGAIPIAAIGIGYLAMPRDAAPRRSDDRCAVATTKRVAFQPRKPLDTSGYSLVVPSVEPWKPDAPLAQIADLWRGQGRRIIDAMDRDLSRASNQVGATTVLSCLKAIALLSEGDAEAAYAVLERAREVAASRPDLAEGMLYTVIYLQGVTGLRWGENENCIMCRGESSCILPIARAAVHAKPRGSRAAIRHFTEYLGQFPDDLEVRWLLNIAHMTLGEHPAKVDPRYVVSLDRFVKSEFDIGRFRDIGHLAGVNRKNQAGGAILDDFDGDGRLDLVVTAFDPTEPMAFYHNKGDGTFEDRAPRAGLADQYGGLVCFQADYDNDGRLDIFIPRGAWLDRPIRPSLLRNEGGTFVDVTESAGLLDPVNSNSASWADYDNDGFVDLFVACERQANRLYHNRGDGTFEDVAQKAGVSGSSTRFCKGSSWIDYDNDDAPDLFLNNLNGSGQLFHNRRDGTFAEVTVPMKIDGPVHGFSCWTWDYDNDGWLDIFATCYDRSLEDVVKGLIGQPHSRHTGRLFRNLGGEGFRDVSRDAGLGGVYATMGSNFGDLDNDGFLDFYLGTGEPSLATLVPNRMFKNVDGVRFAEITGTAGTGHLQKGHGVAIGDWDRDGDADVFIQTGGAVNGDKYHNVFFQNPGQGNRWLTVKLVGKSSNRAAIGARIKAVPAGGAARAVHRHVSSGSSFGANPLEQTIGLGKADRVAALEIHWPTSKTTQVFRDIAAGQSIEITEFADGYRRLDTPAIPTPE